MQISANTAQLAQAVQDVNAKLDAMGAAGKKASDDLSTLKNIEIAEFALGGIKALTGAFVSLAKSAIGAVESVVSFGKSVADELDALNDVANRTGVGVEALQSYGAAAKLAGTDIETFAKSIQKLAVNIGNATDEKSAKKFTDLGIAFEELKAASPTEQFEMVADAISRIADPAERAAAAVKLFGKGGIELGPLFSEGPGALAKMREEAAALGQVVSEDSIKSIAAMNDAFDKVWMTVKGLTGQIVGELAGPIAEIAEGLLAVIKEAGATNIASQVASGLLSFIEMAGNAFFDLAQFIAGFVDKYGKLLGISSQTPEDAQRAALEEERRQLQRTINGEGGATATSRFFAGVRAPRADDRERLAAIDAQLAALSAAGINALAAAQQRFNDAIDSAGTSLAQRTEQAMPSATASATAGGAADGQSEEQTRLLNDIARNTRPPTTVELPR